MGEEVEKDGAEEAGLVGGDGDLGEGVSEVASGELILRWADLLLGNIRCPALTISAPT